MNTNIHFTNISGIPAGNLSEIIALAQAGKQEALAEIYESYFLRVYRFVYYRVSHRETAEDLTEDTFIKAFAGIKNLQSSAAFEGWLFQIARNLVIDYYRKKKQLVPLDAVENTLEYDTNVVEIINLQIEQSILIKLLKELNDEQQSVIKMKFLEELDNSTIAKILNKTEGAIRVIQHRAIGKLKELFQDNIRKE
jgi:RNA polymerase sigma-70 factor (ECF subfamily)